MRWTTRIGPCIRLSSTHRARNASQLAQFIPAQRDPQLQLPLIGPWRRALLRLLLLPPPPPRSLLRRNSSNSSPITRSQTDDEKAPEGSRHDGSGRGSGRGRGRGRGAPGPPGKKRASLAYFVVGGAGLLAAATLLLRSSGGRDGDGDVINRSTFSAFTITSKEQVSPSAFILTVRSSSSSNGKGGGSARIRRARAHGLWSVEIKQPQLQIARHYTPLPPLSVPSPSPSSTSAMAEAEAEEESDSKEPGGGNDDDDGDELRFLVRRMDGGEMSNYLSRLRVGDPIWLRGPHLGFDVARRLGGEQQRQQQGRQQRAGGRSVVFLAGGTGVAPALQVAHRLLDGGGDGDVAAAVDKPAVSILWANRRGADALGRDSADHRREQSTAGGFWNISRFWKRGVSSSSSGDEMTEPSPPSSSSSSLSRQIREMERRYPDNFRVRYFADEEGTFIGSKDILLAATTTLGGAAASPPPRDQKSASLPGGPAPPPPPAAEEECPWHSAAALERLPNDDDASRSGDGGDSISSSPGPACPCRCAQSPGERAGANLLFVSGPDGFIEAYAGPKKWHEGGEMQGPVRGLIGRLKEDGRGELDGWLVLKL